MHDIMIDMETMGTVADSAIISLGAVRFDLATDEIGDQGFYASISLQSNYDYNRTTSEETMRWWMDDKKVSTSAREVFHENKQGLDDALSAFVEWCLNYEEDEIKRGIVQNSNRVWSNGANFDEPMVVHALTQTRLPIPWKFWNVRCFRTWKELPGAKDVAKAVVRGGTHHNAVADALYQARQAQAVYQKLFMKKLVKR